MNTFRLGGAGGRRRSGGANEKSTAVRPEGVVIDQGMMTERDCELDQKDTIMVWPLGFLPIDKSLFKHALFSVCMSLLFVRTACRHISIRQLTSSI